MCIVSEGTANINKHWGTVVAERYGMCQNSEEGGRQQKMKIFAFSKCASWHNQQIIVTLIRVCKSFWGTLWGKKIMAYVEIIIIIIIDLSVTCYQLLNYLPIFKGTLFRSSLQNVVRQAWCYWMLQGLMDCYKFHEESCTENHADRHKLICIRTFNIYCLN